MEEYIFTEAPNMVISAPDLLVNDTKKLISDIVLTPEFSENTLLFLLEDKKVGIIRYEINFERKQCYISFFGTQNGIGENVNYKELLRLDSIGKGEKSKKYISYAMMQSFIETICYPNNLEKIYLDYDDSAKKIFWKEKLGKYFKETGVFAPNGVRSVGTEICFILSKKN